MGNFGVVALVTPHDSLDTCKSTSIVRIRVVHIQSIACFSPGEEGSIVQRFRNGRSSRCLSVGGSMECRFAETATLKASSAADTSPRTNDVFRHVVRLVLHRDLRFSA